ncbi:hypothetical protein [Falsiphaeobacter marinintestinus]|uniref:hypothetical protein n=1 Tax=Falsiphaeobacter marinintestinus TaxID=1492905 RepID=UPI0011B6AC82|nr:hypothetical protein [Phaeobacter marinintestinus]
MSQNPFAPAAPAAKAMTRTEVKKLLDAERQTTRESTARVIAQLVGEQKRRIDALETRLAAKTAEADAAIRQAADAYLGDADAPIGDMDELNRRAAAQKKALGK